MIGYPRWNYDKDAHASEYTHYEASVAHTIGIPVLHVLEKCIQWRGGVDQSIAEICRVPLGVDES